MVTALGWLEAGAGGAGRRLVTPPRWAELNVIATPEAARAHRLVHGRLAAPFLLAGFWLLIVQTMRVITAAAS